MVVYALPTNASLCREVELPGKGSEWLRLHWMVEETVRRLGPFWQIYECLRTRWRWCEKCEWMRRQWRWLARHGREYSLTVMRRERRHNKIKFVRARYSLFVYFFLFVVPTLAIYRYEHMKNIQIHTYFFVCPLSSLSLVAVLSSLIRVCSHTTLSISSHFWKQ